MKRLALTRGAAGALLLGLLVFPACDFDAINTDPNNPVAAPVSNVLPSAQMRVIFHSLGADAGWYSSVWSQHTAGVHAQLHDADQLRGITPTTLNTAWGFAYFALNDFDYVIDTATEAGDSWHYVGIAKVMKAYTWQYMTDLWGRIPYSEALAGSANLRPTYDRQQDIYPDLIRLLDEAIADLQRPSPVTVGRFDLIHNGDAQRWIRAAYSLQARLHNRMSKRDPAGSATAALAAAANGLQSSADDLTFRGYDAATVHSHPWHRERGDRGHHAWGSTMDNIMVQHNDPRREIFAQPMPDGEIVPAPNTEAQPDQAGNLYSKLSTDIVYASAEQPLLTYAELAFIRADAHARLGQFGPARTAMEQGIRAAMQERTGEVSLSQADIDAYIAQPGVIPADNDQLRRRIGEEKWIALFPFQAGEAWFEWRRTGFPVLTNAHGPVPRRAPYAQSEYDTNSENVVCHQDAPLNIGVWWDTGTENCQ